MVEVPKFGYAAQFQLPSDFLRLIAINDHLVDDDGCMAFKVEGNRILAQGSALRLEYVYRAPESLWDAKLVELMAARMLWKLAYPLTQSTSLRDTLKQEYVEMAKMARSIDSQENPSPKFGNDSPLLIGRQ